MSKAKFCTTLPFQLINNLIIFLLEGQLKVKGTFGLEEPKQFLFYSLGGDDNEYLENLYPTCFQSCSPFLLHWHFLQLYACFVRENHMLISDNDYEIIIYFQCWIKAFTWIAIKKANNRVATSTLWKLKNNKVPSFMQNYIGTQSIYLPEFSTLEKKGCLCHSFMPFTCRTSQILLSRHICSFDH